MFMPGRTFPYYLRPYLRYLLSEAADLDALCLFGRLEQKLQFQPADLQPLWPEIQQVLDHFTSEEFLSEADPKYRKRFPRRVARILKGVTTAENGSRRHQPRIFQPNAADAKRDLPTTAEPPEGQTEKGQNQNT